MSKRNREIIDICRANTHLPIIIVGESMADICGYTSTYGKIHYCGSKEYENEFFACKGEIPDFIIGRSAFGTFKTLDGVLEPIGLLKFATPLETLLSLLYFPCNQWGYKAISNLVRYMELDFDWPSKIKELRMVDLLFEKAKTAIDLGEDDSNLLLSINLRLGFISPTDPRYLSKLQKRYMELKGWQSL